MLMDLAPLTGNGKVKNLAGKDKGLAARRMFDLDKLDQGNEAINVVIPSFVYALSVSFFCGMFGGSYDALGSREAFLSHYHFEAPQSLWPQIEQGLAACSLDTKSASAFGHSEVV